MRAIHPPHTCQRFEIQTTSWARCFFAVAMHTVRPLAICGPGNVFASGIGVGMFAPPYELPWRQIRHELDWIPCSMRAHVCDLLRTWNARNLIKYNIFVCERALTSCTHRFEFEWKTKAKENICTEMRALRCGWVNFLMASDAVALKRGSPIGFSIPAVPVGSNLSLALATDRSRHRSTTTHMSDT